MFENLSENDHLREFVTALADRIGLDEDRRQALDIAASLLGVGRLPVADITQKKGARSPEEIARMRDIPGIWADFTDQLAPLKALGVPDIVEAYCENWDGSGYPKGLAGEEIPLGARVLAICYHYNGMISDRAHRAALPHDEAAEEIRRMSGRMLDPALVETFIAMVEEKWKTARVIARPEAEEESGVGAGAASGSPPAAGKPQSLPAERRGHREHRGRTTRTSASSVEPQTTDAAQSLPSVASVPSVAGRSPGRAVEAEVKVKEKPASARKAPRKKSARKKAGAKKKAAKKRAKKQAAKKAVTKKAAKKVKKKVSKKAKSSAKKLVKKKGK